MTGTSTEYTQLPTATTSGDKISDETLGTTGIKIQRVKVVLGDYGVDGGNIASDNALPVTGAFYQATQPVSAAALPLPTGAATASNQPAINGDGGSLAHVTNFPSTQPVSIATMPSTPVTGTVGLNAGSSLVGKFGIDQTTPGTTNAVFTTQGPTSFVYSTVNTSTSQLAAGATFTGTIEGISNEVAISVELTVDQPATLTINQYVVNGGSPGGISSSWSYTVTPGVPFSRAFTANGDYASVVVTNNGSVPTTTLNLSTAYGNLLPVTSAGNLPTALSEISSTLTDTYNTSQYLHVDPSTAGSDGAAYNATSFPQVNMTAGKGSDGYAHAIAVDQFGSLSTQQSQLGISPDTPNWSVLTGDPSGDFAGQSLIELLLDPAQNFTLNTTVSNTVKTDSNKATILSDCPQSIGQYLQVGQYIIIDTIGYMSIDITTGSTLVTSAVQGSNDQLTWGALTGISTSVTVNGAMSASSNFTFPCWCRYIKITATTAGTFAAYLRNAPFTQVQNNNIQWVGGTSVVTAGLAGVMAVGGNIAVGSAPTTNPMSLCWDGSLTRRLLTDAVSGGIVNGSSALGNGQTLGTIIAPTTVTATQIKATAGRLYSMHVGNTNATAVYLKLYNATSVTLGTTSAALNFMIPAASAIFIPINDTGLYFSSGIGVAVSGAQALTDSTALTTTCAVSYSYI